MSNFQKIQLSLAAILTLLGVVVWGVYFNQQTSEEDQKEIVKETQESDTKLFPNNPISFNLEFESQDIVLGLNEESSVNITTNGLSSNVSASEIFVNYDPETILVNSISKGTAFDSYVGEEINEELGLVKLSGGNLDQGKEEDEVFMTLNIQRIAEGETSLVIVGDNEFGEMPSKVISFSEEEIIINGDTLIIN